MPSPHLADREAEAHIEDSDLLKVTLPLGTRTQAVGCTVGTRHRREGKNAGRLGLGPPWSSVVLWELMLGLGSDL